jgi:hypothetical protein
VPSASSHGPFRFVGRLIPLDGPDNPEQPVFIDIPRGFLVVEYEDHEYFDGIANWYTNSAYSSRLDIQTVEGVAYKIHTGAPPEGYFPPSAAPAPFDF